MYFLTQVKQAFQKIIWPLGSIANIQRGHLKGYKFVISSNSGWSPILGRWEPQNHEVFAKVIKPAQTVFDLGANNGIHSLLFAKLVGSQGKVYAFEPLPDNVEEIRKNCKLNNVNNIHIVQAAVGSYDGEIKFFLGIENKQGSIVGIGRQSGNEINVKLTTLRTFIKDEQVTPDFLKIDIEGAESDALLGLEDLLTEIRPAFFIELHTPEQDKKVGEILQRNNYNIYRVIEKNINKSMDIPYLEKINDLSLTYPHPEGIWGNILALPAK